MGKCICIPKKKSYPWSSWYVKHFKLKQILCVSKFTDQLNFTLKHGRLPNISSKKKKKNEVVAEL